MTLQKQVTYKYYLGMLHFLNEEFAKVGLCCPAQNDRANPPRQSEEQLTFAFYNCHRNAQANRE